MNTIVALKNESLDDIVLQCRKDGLITIAKSLEQIDRQIASELDHNRFVPIRNQSLQLIILQYLIFKDFKVFNLKRGLEASNKSNVHLFKVFI